MNVRDLIYRLEKFSGDLPVVLPGGDVEYIPAVAPRVVRLYPRNPDEKLGAGEAVLISWTR